MTDADVDALQRIAPFCRIDATAFPPTLPLLGILPGDPGSARFQSGDLIVRAGDYGHSAFLVLAGNVRVVLERLDPKLLGRDEAPRRSWRQALAQLWQNSRLPEVRRAVGPAADANGSTGIRKEADGTRVFLQDVPRLLSDTGTVQLGQGEIFGELAALGRTQRTATVLADGPTTLLEIRWQGLRDLMRRTPAIREHVEELYRQNSLRVHLRETPILRELPAEALERVVAATVFESYGNFDWFTDFGTGTDRRRDPVEQMANEPLIATEGDRPTGLLLVRSGFARVSRRHGHGNQTVAYLGKGHAFGFEEIAAGEDVVLRHSLRAVGYVDVLRLPLDVVRKQVLPHITSQRVGSTTSPMNSGTIRGEDDAARWSGVDSRLLDFLADH